MTQPEQPQLFDTPESAPQQNLDHLTASSLTQVRWISEDIGYGIFAAADIAAGTTVHLGPVLFLSEAELDIITTTSLNGYVFSWSEGYVAFPLGIAGLFNHSANSNCDYELWDSGDVDPTTGYVHPFEAVGFVTHRHISQGDEITVDYTQGDPDFELWFEAL